MCGISGLIGNFGEINKFIELSNNFLRQEDLIIFHIPITLIHHHYFAIQD